MARGTLLFQWTSMEQKKRKIIKSTFQMASFSSGNKQNQFFVSLSLSLSPFVRQLAGARLVPGRELTWTKSANLISSERRINISCSQSFLQARRGLHGAVDSLMIIDSLQQSLQPTIEEKKRISLIFRVCLRRR